MAASLGTIADADTTAAEEIQPPDDPNRTADTTVIIDTMMVIDTTFAFDTTLISDAVLPMDSVMAVDSMLVIDSTLISDTTLAADTTVAPVSIDSTDTVLFTDSTSALDSIPVNDSALVTDTTQAPDSVAMAISPDSTDTLMSMDSAAVVDTMLVYDTTLVIDSTVTADSTTNALPAYAVDTTMFFDTSFVIDTTLVIELTPAAKKALAEKKKRDKIIEKLATAYFNLAHAYHTILEEPDSALFYYDTLIARFPESEHIPRALFASASLLEDHFQDLIGAAAVYRRVLADFGRTDYAGAAIERLELSGTPADTGYPGAAYREAEKILFEAEQPESARVLFDKIVQEFPKSIYAPQAAYASLIAAEESYQGEDSTLYLLFAAFADSFPGTPYAEEAKEKMGSGIAPRPERKRAVMAAETEDAAYDSALAAIAAEQSDTTRIGLPRAPRPKVAGVFEYPESELGHEPWKGAVLFKILIDFTGQIAEYELVGPSERPDIDLSATTAVEQTFFDPDSIAPESLNMWYQYEVRVIPPAQRREDIFNDPLYDENR